MNGGVLLFPDQQPSEHQAPAELPEPEIPADDPEIPADEDEPAIASDPEPAKPAPPAPTETTALATLPLVEVLPADFKLSPLVRFIPNQALRIATAEAAQYALGVNVPGQGADGLKRADLALTALRASLRAIDDHFEEPCAIANQLHKRLTGIRGEWQAAGKQAADVVGNRIYAEQRRLELIAAEERRKAQEAADREAREAAAAEAKAAEQAQAPAIVVEELKQQARTATAPPVSLPAVEPPKLSGTTTVERWKGRLKGTPGSDEPHPDMAKLSAHQRTQVFELMRAILEGKAPLIFFQLDWGEIDRRANAEKATFAVPGLESFESGSVRAKSSRVR